MSSRSPIAEPVTMPGEMFGAVRRMLPLVGAALLAGILTGDALGLLHAGIAAIRSPYGIDYGEGIVWQQMLSIWAGHGYAPLGIFPAIVFHYPPVYHVTVALLASLTGVDGLAVGRAVSLVATLATAALLGILTRAMARSAGSSAAYLAGWLAGLIYLSCWPVSDWSALMRVDMLANLFGAAGLVLTLRSIDRPIWVHGAALCFVLAIFSKQVSIAAPAAAFAGLATVRPRLALLLTTDCLVMGSAALAALEFTTSGGFLRHIIFYNMNRNELGRLALLVPPLFVHGIYVILAGVAAAGACHRLAGGWQRRAIAPLAVATPLTLLVFLIIKTAMLVMIMKSGGAANYMIEWFGAVAIFAGAAAAPALATAISSLRRQVGARGVFHGVLLLLLAFQASLIPAKGSNPGARPASDESKLAQLVTLIRATRRPVISDEMTLLIRAGKPVLWEPSITAELGSVGRYDQAGFVRMVQAHGIGFFITEGDRGEWLFDSRYNPPVATAMKHYYPVERIKAGLILHLPPPGIDPALDRRTASFPLKP